MRQVQLEGQKLPKLPIAKAPVTRKLDLGCGQRPADGYEGVDIVKTDKVTHVLNLFRYPWPFEDNSAAEIRASHFIEHIPAIEVDPRGHQTEFGDGGQDALLRFFDECWRVLIPGGVLNLVWPSSRSDRAFQDPTHRRYIPEATMLYLDANWRKGIGIDHYDVKCDFEADMSRCGHTFDSVVATKHDHVKANMINQLWNTTIDFVAILKARKP